MHNYIKKVLENQPKDWLGLTTHRLDIYNEKEAKIQFLSEFETLFKNNDYNTSSLNKLPTAYDYIRLGHPLSCILEWSIAKFYNLKAANVISFSSQTMPILSILRKNLLENKSTRILYTGELPKSFNPEILKYVYGYTFDVLKLENAKEVSKFNGYTIFISNEEKIEKINFSTAIDFYISIYNHLGSVLIINGEENNDYVSDIQHVRRRETIAMTPSNTITALEFLVENSVIKIKDSDTKNKTTVLNTIAEITGSATQALVASSGLSIQYAILMGLIHDAKVNHVGKAIKIVVPPNCYGGTNDQARRVVASIDNVAIVDFLVDGDNDMVQNIDTVLTEISSEDAVPLIIAEIPTNPRVEVPNLLQLKEVLSRKRKTKTGEAAIEPVFILDQTFCPNVQFLGEDKILSNIKTIAFASGSKFPSGGQCTAGYCIGNTKTVALIKKIKLHLNLCNNEATAFQYKILAKQMPSMIQRIANAYTNTRDFVNFINTTLPEAKINFVSQELAEQGFTPSVFSLDLPTKGNTEQEKETYKSALNLKLINLMITKIPNESKFCVSYGQLKGCYWTIPATSTQGTTKEGDKDYIVRASLSPNLDLELHKKVFLEFVKSF